MAVEHPVAGIVGDKRDVDPLARLHQDGVHSVELVSPAEDIVLDETEVYAIAGLAVETTSTRDA